MLSPYEAFFYGQQQDIQGENTSKELFNNMLTLNEQAKNISSVIIYYVALLM